MLAGTPDVPYVRSPFTLPLDIKQKARGHGTIESSALKQIDFYNPNFFSDVGEYFHFKKAKCDIAITSQNIEGRRNCMQESLEETFQNEQTRFQCSLLVDFRCAWLAERRVLGRSIKWR